MDLEGELEDKDILIDGGFAESGNNETIGLLEVLENCATVGSDTTVNHAQLNGKDAPDSHPISAITGLKEKIDELTRVGQVCSSEDACAIYYPWYEPYNGEDRTGYFVSYKAVDVGEIGGLIKADGKSDVFGVTVRSAGYIGNDTSTVIDGITVTRRDDPNYGLVGFAGIVNVRSVGNIPIGGRVIPNENGMAEATSNESGFYVLAKGNNSVYDFVTIYLGVNMDSLAKLRGTIADDIGFTEEDKKRLEDAVTSAELAEVLSRLDTLGGSIDNIDSKLDGTAMDIAELEKLIEEAKKAMEAQQESISQMGQQIDETQNSIIELDKNISEKIDDTRKDMQDRIDESVSSVNKDIDNAMSEIAVIMDNVDNLNSNFREGGTITIMQEKIDDNSAKIESLVGGNFSGIQGLTQIKQQVDENGGLIQSLVLDIRKYSVGEFSQSYGMSYDDAVSILATDIIYVPIIAHSENLIRDKIARSSDVTSELNAGTLEERESESSVAHLTAPPFEALDVSEMQTYDFEVLGGLTYRYTWNGRGWVKGAPVSMSTVYFEYDGTSSTTDLWFCWQDVIHEEVIDGENVNDRYEAGTLYSWRGNRWVAVATVKDNVTARSINQVRQTAESYSIQLQNLKGDFSLYEQTVDHIKQVVGGSDGDIGSFVVTKDGLYGDVYNPNGTTTSLKAQADANRAMIDLMASGYYHKLEMSLRSPIPSPTDESSRYSVRPEWSVKDGRFIFNEAYKADDGIYYFFDTDKTHYCKVIGNGYEVYGIGDIITAGTDIQISEYGSSVDTLATFSNDKTSTLSAVRNLALENEAKIEQIASLSTNIIKEIVNDSGFIPPVLRYSDKPEWDSVNQKYVYSDSFIDADGLYFAGDIDTFCKLIPDGNGGFIGYEVYTHDFSGTASIVQQVKDNQSSIGMVVTADKDGKKVDGGVLVNAINGQSNVAISGDRIDIKGITTVSNSSGSNTVINGSYITTGTIKSSNYSYSSGNYSNAGTSYDLSNGAIRSKNYSIDSNGNLHLRGTLDGCDGTFSGTISGGSINIGNSNFVVDSSGNLTAKSGSFKGTVNATDLQINGSSILTMMSGGSATSSSKIKADYLELKGLTITNGSKTTFKIDSSGNVTVDGNIVMGSGSSISWNSITGVPREITDAYDLAEDAYNYANKAYNLADNAYDRADDAYGTVSGWVYEGSTYIDGTMIATGTVMASKLIGGEVQLLTSSERMAGGMEITGSSSSSYAIELWSGGALRFTADNGAMYLSSSSSSGKCAMTFRGYNISCDGNLIPANGSEFYLGNSSVAWDEVWAFSYENASDRNKKNSIEYDMDKYEALFFELKPTQFKFNNGKSGRYHVGFISQDVGESIENVGLSSQDFAAFVKAPREEKTNDGSDECDYYLRYSEFIALNTHMIQKLYKKIDMLEDEITKLKEKQI